MFVNPRTNLFNYDLNGNQLGFAPSQFSPGGQYALAPTNQYINPYQNSGGQQQQSSGPNLLDFASNARSLYNGGSSGGSGILGNATSAINNFGGSLGFATTAPAATYTGVAGSLPWQVAGSLAPASATGAGATLPWLAGGVEAAGTVTQGAGIFGSGLGGAGTLSGALGAAGLGAFAGSFLGKIGGNSTGGSIGGGIGAGIGVAVGGPVGAVIGGAIGGIAGGFFGNKKPGTNSDEHRGQLNEDGTYKEYYQGGKNAGAYAGFGKASTNNVSNMLQRASKELGIKFNKDIIFGGGISTRHGGSHISYGVGNSNTKAFYDYNDKDATNEAMKKVLLFAAQNSGVEDIDKVNKWYDDTLSGKNAANSGAYVVPFKSKPRFDDFMTKFKSQDNVNVSTPADPVTTAAA